MKTKKTILKKACGKGGVHLERIGNTMRNVADRSTSAIKNTGDIVRTITKSNDIKPKESPRINFPTPRQAGTITTQVKPAIPYSKSILSPGPTNLTNVVVPSSRIPSQANPNRAIPEPRVVKAVHVSTGFSNPETRTINPLPKDATDFTKKGEKYTPKILKKTSIPIKNSVDRLNIKNGEPVNILEQKKNGIIKNKIRNSIVTKT